MISIAFDHCTQQIHMHGQVGIGEHAESIQCVVDQNCGSVMSVQVCSPYANCWSLVDDGNAASIGLHIAAFVVRIVRCAHAIATQPFEHIHVFDQCGHVKTATVDLWAYSSGISEPYAHLHIFVHAISMTVERFTVDQQRPVRVFHIAEAELLRIHVEHLLCVRLVHQRHLGSEHKY